MNQEAAKQETKQPAGRTIPPIVPGFMDSRFSSYSFLHSCFLIHSFSARSEIRTECGKIQYNHNESEEIQAHCQSNGDMHCQNANQPEKPSLFHPNKKWIADFDETD
jgi:hypothetical protein